MLVINWWKKTPLPQHERMSCAFKNFERSMFTINIWARNMNWIYSLLCNCRDKNNRASLSDILYAVSTICKVIPRLRERNRQRESVLWVILWIFYTQYLDCILLFTWTVSCFLLGSLLFTYTLIIFDGFSCGFFAWFFITEMTREALNRSICITYYYGKQIDMKRATERWIASFTVVHCTLRHKYAQLSNGWNKFRHSLPLYRTISLCVFTWMTTDYPNTATLPSSSSSSHMCNIFFYGNE